MHANAVSWERRYRHENRKTESRIAADDERSQLQSFARSQSLTAALGARARIVLSSADGELNNAIAERLGLTEATVGK